MRVRFGLLLAASAALFSAVWSSADAQTVAPATPVFLKVSPDMGDEDKADIAAIAPGSGLDGLIISNTTIARDMGLRAREAGETGGLSGAPLFALSTRVLGEFYAAIGDRTTLIGVGGVSTARQAYVKILAGASLVQLYSALVYEGPGLPYRILQSLPGLLEADSFKTIKEAVGAKAA